MRMAALAPLALAVVCMSLPIGCGGGPPSGPSSSAPLTEGEESKAIGLFQSEGCNACHGDRAEGLEGAGPALRDLAPYWDVDRVMAYLADPEGFRAANPDFEDRRDTVYELEMPAFDHLTEDQRRLLARWLLSR